MSKQPDQSQQKPLIPKSEETPPENPKHALRRQEITQPIIEHVKQRFSRQFLRNHNQVTLQLSKRKTLCYEQHLGTIGNFSTDRLIDSAKILSFYECFDKEVSRENQYKQKLQQKTEKNKQVLFNCINICTNSYESSLNIQNKFTECTQGCQQKLITDQQKLYHSYYSKWKENIK